MMKLTAKLTLIVFLYIGNLAYAGTQVIGVEIGVSTYSQVRNSLPSQVRMKDEGINKFTNGPMFGTDGSAQEIEGLTSVFYIFDEQERLAGVLMDMRKDRFDAVFKALSGKYKVVTQERPFVGNQYARFKVPDATIEIDAPHLSFTMSVRYIRNDLMQAYRTQSAAEAETKRRKESAKF